MLTLAAYLEREGLTQAEFAQRFDPPVSQALVSRWLIWLEWRANPGPLRSPPRQSWPISDTRALDIEAATQGAVSRHYLCPDYYGPMPAERAVA